MSCVSVIIPTCNRARLVVQAVESVLAQQPGARAFDLEILVIDGGSADGTAEALARFGERVRRIPTATGSIGGARNVGLAQARGDLIAFLDSDDLWRADKLRRQLDLLDAQPEVGAVGSGYTRIDACGRPLPRTLLSLPRVPSGNVFAELAMGQGSILLSSLIVRRALLAAGEGFRTDMRIAEDTEFILRLARRTRIAAVAEPLVSYRVHTQQTLALARTAEMVAAHQIIRREHLEGGPLTPAQRARALAEQRVRWAAWSVRERRASAARRQIGAALRLCPSMIARRRWWGVLALSLAPWLLRAPAVTLAYANPVRTHSQEDTA